MFDNIENLKLISCLKKPSQRAFVVKGRNLNGFNIRVSGKVVYNFSGEETEVSPGEVIFIPQNSRYTCTVISESDSICTSINFEGNFENPKPLVFSLEDFYEYEFLSEHFADMWKFGNASHKYKCQSCFYNLLSFISGNENISYANKKKFDLINPAAQYLKNHMYDTNLKTEKLHTLCGISDTYFRKIFILRFKTTPKDYIISKRVSHAKSIIDSGDFTTVKDLALSVGYTDSLYFGKVFKKIYGASPSVFNK